MIATQEEMDKAGLDMQWRDYCAHLLIPLNKCRSRNYYLPDRCVHERHTYEKCQYQDYLRRLKEMADIKKKKKEEGNIGKGTQ